MNGIRGSKRSSFGNHSGTYTGLIVASLLSSIIILALVSSPLSSNLFQSRNVRDLLEEEILESDAPAPITEHYHHKALFPLDERDYAGTILVALGSMIAASGGIGGGGMLVPILILVFGFHPKYAIPLSNFTIVGSSITNMVMNLSKRHPDANRPLVDWDLILVMEPLTMGGAIVGAIMSKILPDWILVISLVILLAYTTKITLEKGFQLYQKENAEFLEESRSALSKVSTEGVEMAERKSLLSGSGNGSDEEEEDEENQPELQLSQQTLQASLIQCDPSTSPIENTELAELLEQESKTPMDKVVIISVMVVVVIVLNLLKGGGGAAAFPSPIGIRCGSTFYWIVTALVFAWVIGISLAMRKQLMDKWQTKTRLGYQYVRGDVEWNPRNTIIYPCLCFFAGLFAGLFGVGGGIVKGPLMLHMGVHPLVTSGTCAVMIMFTSVAATAMFVAFGTLTMDYAIFLFVVGLVTTAIGQFGVSYLVVKYRRVSLVSLSIGAVVAISTALMAVQSVFSLIDAQDGAEPPSTLCSS